MTAVLASLKGLHKRFGDVHAVRGVELEIRAGEVLALVGENGAGKSTLMRLFAGVEAPDAGSVTLGGRVMPPDPAAAIAAGLGMVHQHFMLVGEMTVLENVVLGHEPTKGALLDLSPARARLVELAREAGLAVDPDRRVDDLSVGERQRVEILKVLYRGARILVLDEPTAVLTADESGRLLDMVRGFVARGADHAAVIITHKLDEVLAVADRIVVLRRGERVLESARGTATAESLADAMVGRHVELPRRVEDAAAVAAGRPVLEVRGLEVRGAAGTLVLHDVTLAVGPGEILGIAGVDGNGQAELVAAIAGLVRPERGTVWLGGRDVTRASVAERQRLGLSVVHEDRQVRGLVLGFSLAENFALGRQDEWTRRGLLDHAAIAAATTEGMRLYDVRAAGPEARAGELSGGNQQKVVLARELGRAHVALVAAQPTRGVDVGAIEVIRRELLAERAAGRAVLLVSADLAELRALCDRVAVLYRGRVQGVVPVAEASDERLGRWMTGAGAEVRVAAEAADASG